MTPISPDETVGRSLQQLIALLDEASGGCGYARHTETHIPTSRVLAAARRHLAEASPDPEAARHRAELLGDPCGYPGCIRLARSEQWCGVHEPDEVAIQRAMAGDPVPLLAHERETAIRKLSAQGLFDREVAKRLHIADRTVWRIRQREGIEAVSTNV